MSANNPINYGTLSWVKAEIDETLEQARHALEAYVENTEDETQLRFCITYIHQVYGTLQMIELYGASLVMEESEHVAKALLGGEISRKDDAYEILMRGILQLPDYLEKIQGGVKDDPLILLPLLNDMRAVRGAKLLSENVLFTADINTAGPVEVAADSSQYAGIEIRQLAKKLRHNYQLGLLGWYRGLDDDAGLGTVDHVLSELEQACTNEDLRRLWWVGRGVVEALKQGDVKPGVAVKLLLGHLDNEIKGVIDRGEEPSGNINDITKNLLYYLANCGCSGERVEAIRKKFDLADVLARQEEIQSAREAVSAPGLNMMSSVAEAIKDDLMRVKDALDLVLRSGDAGVEGLSAQVLVLNKIADTLGMLGQGVSRNIIQDQVAVIEDVQAGNRDFDDGLLMEVASALLAVESSLDILAAHAPVMRNPSLAADGDAGHTLPEAEMRKIQSAVLKEAIADIDVIKETMVAFINGPWDYSQLEVLPSVFERIRGGMQMMTLAEVAVLIDAAEGYVKQELLGKRIQPSHDDLEQLADAITGIEYYMEALLESRMGGEMSLQLARTRLQQLGCEIELHAVNEAAETDDLSAPTMPTEEAGALDEAPANVLEFGEFEELLEEGNEEPSAEFNEEPSAEFNEEPSAEFNEEPSMEFYEEATEDSFEELLAGFYEEPPADSAEELSAEVHVPDAPAAVLSQDFVEDDMAEVVPVATMQQDTIEDDLDEDILDIFVEEAEEELEAIRETLPRWIEQPDDLEKLGRIRRAYHTLKGSGRMVGANLIGEYAWSLENMLNRVLDKTIELNETMIGLIEKSIELIPVMVECLRSGEAVKEDVQSLIDKASGCIAAGKPSSGPEEMLLEEVEASLEPLVREVSFEAADESVMDLSLLEVFAKESLAHIAEVHQFINRCKEDQQQCMATDALVRALHTLHGSSRMAEADQIANVSGMLEKYIKTLMGNASSLPAEGLDVLEGGLGCIESALDRLERNEAGCPDVSGLLDRIKTLYNDELAKEEQRLRAEHEAALARSDAEEDESEFDEELVEVFLEEALEILDNSEVLLKRWAQEQGSKEIVAELQRELHTLKGGARMAGIAAIGDLSHAIESLLESITEGNVKGSPVELMHRVLDHLYGMLQQTQQRMPLEPADALLDEVGRLLAGEEIPSALIEEDQQEALVEEVVSEPVAIDELEVPLTEPVAETQKVPSQDSSARDISYVAEPVREVSIILPEQHAQPASGAPAAEVARKGKESATEMVRVSAELLNDLVNYAGEASIYRSRIEQQVNAFSYNLVELDQTVSRLREQLRNLDMETEAQILFRYEREAESEKDDFDPLEMDRYSTMQQLSRALMETTSDISSIQTMFDGLVRESETLLLQQSRVNTDLQEGLMRTRMVSFQGLVPRMRRLVRQTSKELNKKVELHLLGEQGEMDRTLLERITAPLEHILRNAISHGIESVRERKEMGKPSMGQIRLAIAREGGDVVVQVADDGAGMNLQAIREKAIERGLMTENTVLRDEDILQFVFEAGFSTAKNVTQVSGRGVGMDVVNSEIKQLGGSLYIDSVPDKGTAITMRLPFTLAVNQALLFTVGEENYAVPLTSIEGIVRMSQAELEHFLSDQDARYFYAGNEYRVQSMSAMLGNGVARIPPGIRMFPVMLVRIGDYRAAIQVEHLLGSREIVVKSVGPQLSTVRGISGATILGNGDVVLILDIGTIIRVGATLAQEAAVAHTVESGAGAISRERPLVMVVDDSITVRKVTTRLLERNNMDVITAKDGVDAVSILQEHIPDVMLLDIEMPRMDGFELATYMRNEASLQEVPIIMITSRTGDKHRKRAMGIGVNGYLGKPYQEGDLLDSIGRLVKQSLSS